MDDELIKCPTCKKLVHINQLRNIQDFECCHKCNVEEKEITGVDEWVERNWNLFNN
jgi:acetyl-CoA carboxylase beta subunit